MGGSPLTTDVKPVTMTNAGLWIPAHRTSDPEITSGFLRFSDPDYAVVEMDLDGATLKAFNFVQGIQHANTEMKTADTPTDYGIPSLRSAGLAVAKTGNAPLALPELAEQQQLQRRHRGVPARGRSRSTSRTSRGATGSMCGQRRRADGSSSVRGLPRRTPGLGGYGIGAPPTVVPVPKGDEGWVEPATTQSASSGGPPNPPVYVPEYLMRWAGWSLVGARPGKHLSDVPSDGLEPDAANPANSDLQLQIDYAAAPGTLPTLRFGGTYRFRARAVDIAGNSVAFTETGAFTWATPEVTYRRFEPVPSPVLVPTAPPDAG
jgi:hypothetical protein